VNPPSTAKSAPVQPPLSSDNKKSAIFAVSDVMALVYMAFALAFVGLAHGMSGPLLAREAARLQESGRTWTSKLAYALAGDTRVDAATGETPPTKIASATPDPKLDTKSDAKDAKRDATGSGSAMTVVPETAKAGDGKERTPAQIFTEFAPAVVTVTIKHDLLGEGGGTGFVIDADGTIGTNYHVIERAANVSVKLMDGTVLDEVEILITDEEKDLALIKVKPKAPLPTVWLGDSDKITVGERAVSIGNPLGLDHTLTDGLVSARRVIQGRKMIQMSVPVSPGNSGGPLFNSRGEVIGVSTAIYSGGSPLAQNLNLAMPINDLKALIKADYPARRKPGATSSERW
jgi:S1-C subfamily serine protease